MILQSNSPRPGLLGTGQIRCSMGGFALGWQLDSCDCVMMCRDKLFPEPNMVEFALLCMNQVCACNSTNGFELVRALDPRCGQEARVHQRSQFDAGNACSCPSKSRRNEEHQACRGRADAESLFCLLASSAALFRQLVNQLDLVYNIADPRPCLKVQFLGARRYQLGEAWVHGTSYLQVINCTVANL